MEIMELKRPVVFVRNADLWYRDGFCRRDKNWVLMGLNMTVLEGTIYGLLGGSGCGKTTVLSCIVGLRQVDNGIVRVLGGRPGDRSNGVPGHKVGYMPQETALHGEFTIGETFRFYGLIYSLPRQFVGDKAKFLTDFLHLPGEQSVVKELSGGQKRRLSFAVALLHDPEILILDEPTVGVDPMLRRDIWKHMANLVEVSKKTIIITTHYIEEASNASHVGLMRHGRLLAEANPQKLTQNLNCRNLEEAFLQLCFKDKTTSSTKEYEESEKITELPPPDPPCGKCAMISCGHINALVMKSCISMWRKFISLVILFLAPVFQITLFTIAVGRSPVGLPFALVNEETSTCTQPSPGCPLNELIHHLIPPISLLPQNACDLYIPKNMSCFFEFHLRNHSVFDIQTYETEQEAIEDAKDNKVWGVVTIKKNFSCYEVVSHLQPAANGQQFAQIESRKDLTNHQLENSLAQGLTTVYKRTQDDIFKRCGSLTNVSFATLEMGEPAYGDEEPSFTDFMAPGMIVLIIFFLAMSLTTETFVSERSEGRYSRLWVAGVLPTEMILAHIASFLMVSVGQTALTLVTLFAIFKVSIEGNVMLVVGIMLLQGVAGMCFGILVSSISDTHSSAMQLGMGSMYPGLLLSGILWPSEAIPKVLRDVAYYLPNTMAVQAIRDVMTRGWTIAYPSVYLGFLSSLAWIIVLIAASWSIALIMM